MINPHLAHLESTGLLRLAQTLPDMEYLFRHALVQDAAYASLLIADRQRIHQNVATTVARLFADKLDDLAPVLAQHYALAGNGGQAIHYYILAGDAEAGRYANAEAIDHYQRALALIQQNHTSATPSQLSHLCQKLGRTLELCARFDEAMAHYQHMETLAGQHQDDALKLLAMMAQAVIHSTHTPYYQSERGQDLANQSLSLARQLNNQEAEAKTWWTLMLNSNYQGQGQCQQAIAYGQQAITLCRQQGFTEQLAFALNDISEPYSAVGQLAQAREALSEANTLWRALNIQPMLGDNLARLASSYYIHGNYDQAFANATEALHIAETIGNPWGQTYTRWTMGPIFWERGNINKVIQLREESIKLAEQIKLGAVLPAIYTELGLVYAHMGDVATAQTFAMPAQNYLATLELPPSFYSWGIAGMARLEIACGNLAAAQKYLHQLLTDFEDDNFTTITPLLAGMAQIELALAQQNYAETLRLADIFLARLERWGLLVYKADGLYLKARAAIALHQFDAAAEMLQAAQAVAAAIGSRWLLWQILATLSQIELDPARAKTLRQQARESIEDIAANTPETLRPFFLNLSQVVAVLKP